MQSNSIRDNNYSSRIIDLENRLAEAEELINSIKSGEVAAFAMQSENNAEIFALQSDYAYRVLIENFGEGVLNLTENGLIVYSNKYFYELLGLSYEKVVGNQASMFIHPGSMVEFNSLFAKALRGQSKGELNFISGNKIIPVYVSMTSLFPQLPTVGMIVTDLSEKKNNEGILADKNRDLEKSNRQLQDAKNFINNVLISTNHGVLTCLPIRENNKVVDFEIAFANEVALEQLEQSNKMRTEKLYLKTLPVAREHNLFNTVLRVNETGVIETHEIKSPGRERWFEVHYVPLEDGVTCTLIEITTIRKQAIVLEEKNMALERSNAELASFSYIASHDLQEPLRKIQTFSNRILAKEGKSFNVLTADYFQRIIKASIRMQDLIAALLNYSRTNTSDLVFIPTDMNALVEEVKTNIREFINENNAIIEISALPTLNIIPMQFSQVFSNIIMNSIKYRNPQVNPEIKISASVTDAKELIREAPEKKGMFWKIKIADNGIGFDQEHADKIFGLFQRLHGRNEYEGTGIGLSICKKIIQNHKGVIKAEGSPGKGAIFNIYIPINSAAA